ncbi:MAG: hypothetical protein CMC76_04285 [Flavobacteriaceae bacterium]|uniref:hypothetical protein n=1 Tax=Winogradskyella sp. SYSU M77433 TaxID=3042722 RepID=UPI000C3CE813|nr:hypothetical protein [Winogradskyella sp. SYSU M77433]MAX70307.1 hypothetical protein [Flavobacteriaceae bacterium]MDH7911786.1 hypothetical protein [Winogradskyella sp. SYSU M77433]|tara:strand:+ start:513 stop:854 length:342 start_codon:yes stop_codon:yes gene_type:complete
MKKVITLCLFVFAMFIGNQTLTAQNTKLQDKVEVNAQASEKTETLRRALKFDNTQRDNVYEVLKTYYSAKLGFSRNENTLPAEIEKNEKRLDTELKAILTDEQYTRYKTLSQD